MNGNYFDMWGVRVASAAVKSAYKDQLIQYLDEYYMYGINALTVFYLGSSGGIVDPFLPNGTGFADAGVRDNMREIISACDSRGMAVIVGIFYQHQAPGAGLENWNASVEAVKTVARELRDFGHQNVIVNIANEQNSDYYETLPWGHVRDPNVIIELCNVFKNESGGLLCGGGGYHDDNNMVIGQSDSIDALLFDTQGREDEWHTMHFYALYRHYGINKPMVNVEVFAGWTERFTPPGGNFDAASGRWRYLTEAESVANVTGMCLFFHANPWFQGVHKGLKTDQPTRFDIGGAGTAQDPGWLWYLQNLTEIRRKQ
eukprot:CAMPEP_0170169026 /NCGR_PEP_ID=MMETSP0040_2-20121228/1957_1 /TAXON_ID=641309 /ORGANISM="Lotharella oceanica, Strain CCMP622" /LENGTH=314 /DNA_ID=CAMNT_0010407523 /DNA_START=57 /DNA_END=1001 /DNA_ORIENTATION=-